MKKVAALYLVRICLGLYLVSLFWVLFVSALSTNRTTYFKNEVKERKVQLIPFLNTYRSFKDVFSPDFKHPEKKYYQRNVVYNVLGNLILFFPWGLLTPLVFKKFSKNSRIIVSALLISITAELIQYMFKIGVFDVDDILYNVIGAIGGFYLLHLISHPRKT